MGDASILNLNEITELVDFHRSKVAVHLKKGRPNWAEDSV